MRQATWSLRVLGRPLERVTTDFYTTFLDQMGAIVLCVMSKVAKKKTRKIVVEFIHSWLTTHIMTYLPCYTMLISQHLDNCSSPDKNT